MPLWCIRVQKCKPITKECHLEFLCSYEGGFLTLEASWCKVLTLDQLKKEGGSLASVFSICGAKYESICQF